ncbi:o-succinylbenzoate--CoA ligase [Actinophytocola gossypii]|uniref:AMP-binding protein n=1 Tax=Actinophytocola gossypii TaxID=2812003 RepID=A0ABT2JCR1_9PSEU|nr:o-succinylbenzoate--CoA ligase [Actinophytocola gossypii]MCT2585642.1 AMP-binding protein [Actinophytocola gossypii]
MRVVELAGPGDVAELTAAVRAALDGSGPAVLPVSAGDPRRGELVARLAPERPVAPGTALVVATSGSTGVAKGVLLSARALTASATATHARLGGPGRWLLTLPGQHIAGVQVIVRALLAGAEPVVAHTFAEGADQLFRLPGPHYTALVPTQLARMVDEPDTLRRFDAVLLGGAVTPARLLDRARDAGIRVVTTYGMSETAGGCVYDGLPLDGVGVRIADGLVELSGPTLADGYRLDPAATEAAFAGGWFRTADLGTLHEGRLTVHGRADFVINTGGVKVVPAAVEDVLTAQPGVAEACVVDLPDQEWGQLVAAAVVPADPAAPPPVSALRDAVRAALGGPSVPKLVRFADALPLRGPGKVDRAGVRAALRKG